MSGGLFRHRARPRRLRCLVLGVTAGGGAAWAYYDGPEDQLQAALQDPESVLATPGLVALYLVKGDLTISPFPVPGEEVGLRATPLTGA